MRPKFSEVRKAECFGRRASTDDVAERGRRGSAFGTNRDDDGEWIRDAFGLFAGCDRRYASSGPAGAVIGGLSGGSSGFESRCDQTIHAAAPMKRMTAREGAYCGAIGFLLPRSLFEGRASLTAMRG